MVFFFFFVGAGGWVGVLSFLFLLYLQLRTFFPFYLLVVAGI